MRVVWIALVVIVLGLGWAGVEFYQHRCQVTYSIDLGSIIDAAVFLGVGAFIEFAYQKRSSDKRADTELLLSIVAEVKTALLTLGREAISCETQKPLTLAQQRSLTTAERDVSLGVYSLEDALQHAGMKTETIQFEKLKDARGELKDSLTDTPYPGPYDISSLLRIRAAQKNMRNELTRIAFAINHR